MQVLKRTIGLTFNEENGTATIRVWAPEAKQVQLKTDQLQLALAQEEMGYWSASTDAIVPGDRYQMAIDGQLFPDPASLSQPEGVHGRSEVLNLSCEWQDANWRNPALEDYIIYEVHTGTFSEAGTFEGIAARLDHLLELGITAVEIMPVAAFPGERNWGYDGVFPFAVQHSYGGARGLQEFIQLCHAKGLAVILDVVYNHLGPEGNYLPEFGPYFTSKYQSPWGAAINFDDANCDGVRQFVIENVLMWFRDFHVDALRLDAVHAIKDYSALHLLQEIRQYTDELMQESGKVHYLLAECDLNDPRYISPVSNNGMGMDGQWVDEFHHALRRSAGEEARGYYADFSGVADLAKSFEDAYVYTGAYSQERKRRFGQPATGHPGRQFIVFSQNHDQVGNRMLGERSSQLYSFGMQKLMAAAVLFSPYVPLLFMGEEWAASSPFLYFVSHGDETLIQQVREGRSAEFAEMHAGGTAPDPQDPETFEASKLKWTELSSAPGQQLFNWYKLLIGLRKSEPMLRCQEHSITKTHVYEEERCLVLERSATDSGSLICCFLNFSAVPARLSLPPGIALIQKIADSSEVGDNEPEHLQPESFIAYSAQYV